MSAKMSSENQIALLAFVNLTADAVKRVITMIEPVLNPVLTAVQIAIAVATLIWILQRVKGAKLDNKLKLKKLVGRKRK